MNLILKFNITTILLLCFFASEAQVFEWAKGMSSIKTYEDPIKDVRTDNSGNSYVLGEFRDSIEFNGNIISSAGSNFYIAKYNSAGQSIWLRHYPIDYQSTPPNPNTYRNIKISSLDIDNSGNYYFSGEFRGTVLFGSIQMSNTTNSYKAFVVKCDDAGNVLFAQRSFGTGFISRNTISVNRITGEFFLTGFSGGSSQFGTQQILTPGYYVVKYPSNGNASWAKGITASLFGGPGHYSYNNKSAVDGFGNIYILAVGGDSLTFGNGIFLSGASAFIAKYSSNGICAWAQPLIGNTTLLDLDVNSEGYCSLVADEVFSVAGLTLPNYLAPGIYTSPMVAVFSPQGNLQWAKRIKGTAFLWATHITETEEVYITGDFSNTLTIDSLPALITLQTPQLWGKDGFIARFNSIGQAQMAQRFGGYNHEETRGIGSDDDGNIYLGGFYGYYGQPGGGTTTFTSTTAYFGGLTLQSTNYGSFLTKLSFPSNLNQISGRVFLDLNSSGIFDTGDQPLPAFPVGLQPAVYPISTSSTGMYSAQTGTGNYTIQLPYLPDYYTTSPASHTATFSGQNQSDLANDFALQPTSPVQDLQISIIQYNEPRSGFDHTIGISYKNVGTITINGSVELIPDAVHNYTISNPVATPAGAGVLSWNFSNLQPLESRHIYVEFAVAGNLPPDSSVSLTATVLPVLSDQTPANNSFTLNTQIVASYDPNDKLVSQEMLSIAEVQAQQPLVYTVRFQNTGNAPATIVSIQDSLSDYLDLSTLQLIASSHPCNWVFQTPTLLEWRFPGIVLPDSNSNEPASHGFVQYRVKPNANLGTGKVMKTRAHIYFDFNAPVATNSTLTRVDGVDAGPDFVNQQLFSLYPNPSRGTFTIKAKVKPALVQINLVNLLGQTVKQARVNPTTDQLTFLFDAEKIPVGVYLLELKNDGKRYVQRVVLQQ